MNNKIKLTASTMILLCILSYLWLFYSVYSAKIKMDKDFEQFSQKIEEIVNANVNANANADIERDVSPIPYDYLGEFILTHYCDCLICTGTAKGSRTASGTKPKQGRTIACDGKTLKMGDIVYIDTIGLRVCEDRGGAIKGNKIDVFVADHNQAVNMGVKKAKVYKLLWL